jgi:hypothetical protein
VFLAIVAALYFARAILIPLTLAVLLSILLAPLVGLLRRLRIGRIPAVLLAVITAVGLVLAVGGVIGTQIAELVDNVPAYAQTIESKVGTVRAYATDEIGRIAIRLGYGDMRSKCISPTRHRSISRPVISRRSCRRWARSPSSSSWRSSSCFSRTT